MECSWARTKLRVKQLGTGTNNPFPKRLWKRNTGPQNMRNLVTTQAIIFNKRWETD
jgi:hypothetical protein